MKDNFFREKAKPVGKMLFVTYHKSNERDRRVLTPLLMTVKRKLSESAIDQANGSERRLRSGRTTFVTTSPVKHTTYTGSPSRSESSHLPRKRIQRDVAQKDDVTEDNSEFPLKSLRTLKCREINSQKGTRSYSDAITVEDQLIPKEETLQIYGDHGAGKELSTTGCAASEIPHEMASDIRRVSKRGKVVVASLSPSSIPSMSRPHAEVGFHFSDERLVATSEVDGSDTPYTRLCLDAQKKEMLQALHDGLSNESTFSTTNEIALNQLSELLKGSVLRAEGNSCLILGPRGSGKSRIIEKCLDSLDVEPIILRLSGWVQATDKQALRGIISQLFQQVGSSLLVNPQSLLSHSTNTENDDDNPFLDRPADSFESSAQRGMHIPPSSQLYTLIPVLLTLNRPVIIVLDAFDLFALHPRQSLLYCLLDAVQSCRAISGNHGIAVIGATSRLDTIHLLEKRVKSRFSGRIIRTAPPNDLKHWIAMSKSVLQVPIALENVKGVKDWHQRWSSSVEEFLSDSRVLDIFKESFSLSRDPKVLRRLLTCSILSLKPRNPYLTFRVLSTSVDSQRSRPPYTQINNVSYPMICLLIASIHASTTGHTTFTFEMLYECFRDQLRASTSAPVQVNGGHIGMVKCTREILMTAFDGLASSRIFIPTVISSSSLAKEFIKHRCVLDRETVKKVVERTGQIYLKRWLSHKE